MRKGIIYEKGIIWHNSHASNYTTAEYKAQPNLVRFYICDRHIQNTIIEAILSDHNLRIL